MARKSIVTPFLEEIQENELQNEVDNFLMRVVDTNTYTVDSQGSNENQETSKKV